MMWMLIVSGAILAYFVLGVLVRVLGTALAPDDRFWTDDDPVMVGGIVLLWPGWLLFLVGAIVAAIVEGAAFVIARVVRRWREPTLDRLQRQIDELEQMKRELSK